MFRLIIIQLVLNSLGQTLSNNTLTEYPQFPTATACEEFYTNPDLKTFLSSERGRLMYQNGGSTIVETHQCTTQ
jgi:hypothetical protein